MYLGCHLLKFIVWEQVLWFKGKTWSFGQKALLGTFRVFAGTRRINAYLNLLLSTLIIKGTLSSCVVINISLQLNRDYLYYSIYKI